MRNRERLVWLTHEGVSGNMVGPMGAYYTMISYAKDGLEYEVFVENDEFEIIEGEDIEYN